MIRMKIKKIITLMFIILIVTKYLNCKIAELKVITSGQKKSGSSLKITMKLDGKEKQQIYPAPHQETIKINIPTKIKHMQITSKKPGYSGHNYDREWKKAIELFSEEFDKLEIYISGGRYTGRKGNKYTPIKRKIVYKKITKNIEKINKTERIEKIETRSKILINDDLATNVK